MELRENIKIIVSLLLFVFLQTHAITNRFEHEFLYSKHSRHFLGTLPIPDWELGLHEAIYQTLSSERNFHAENLQDFIHAAPLIGRQDTATPFGDIAIVARGQLYSSPGGFHLLQDLYENDCDGCHSKPPKCDRVPCELWQPQGHERLLALWSVKRIRHRDFDYGYRYEFEYKVSPMNVLTDEHFVTRHGKFDYGMQGKIFIAKVDPHQTQHRFNNQQDHSHTFFDTLNSPSWNPNVGGLHHNGNYLPPPPIPTALEYDDPDPRKTGYQSSLYNPPDYYYLGPDKQHTTERGTKSSENDFEDKLFDKMPTSTEKVSTTKRFNLTTQSIVNTSSRIPVKKPTIPTPFEDELFNDKINTRTSTTKRSGIQTTHSDTKTKFIPSTFNFFPTPIPTKMMTILLHDKENTPEFPTTKIQNFLTTVITTTQSASTFLNFPTAKTSVINEPKFSTLTSTIEDSVGTTSDKKDVRILTSTSTERLQNTETSKYTSYQNSLTTPQSFLFEKPNRTKIKQATKKDAKTTVNIKNFNIFDLDDITTKEIGKKVTIVNAVTVGTTKNNQYVTSQTTTNKINHTYNRTSMPFSSTTNLKETTTKNYEQTKDVAAKTTVTQLNTEKFNRFTTLTPVYSTLKMKSTSADINIPSRNNFVPTQKSMLINNTDISKIDIEKMTTPFKNIIYSVPLTISNAYGNTFQTYTTQMFTNALPTTFSKSLHSTIGSVSDIAISKPPLVYKKNQTTPNLSTFTTPIKQTIKMTSQNTELTTKEVDINFKPTNKLTTKAFKGYPYPTKPYKSTIYPTKDDTQTITQRRKTSIPFTQSNFFNTTVPSMLHSVDTSELSKNFLNKTTTELTSQAVTFERTPVVSTLATQISKSEESTTSLQTSLLDLTTPSLTTDLPTILSLVTKPIQRDFTKTTANFLFNVRPTFYKPASATKADEFDIFGNYNSRVNTKFTKKPSSKAHFMSKEIDDIFGKSESKIKSTTDFTKVTEAVPSDIKSTIPKIIYSNFYESSTEINLDTTTDSATQSERLTSQSYSTSVSFTVNKKHETRTESHITDITDVTASQPSDYASQLSSEKIANIKNDQQRLIQLCNLTLAQIQMTDKTELDNLAVAVLNNSKPITHLRSNKIEPTSTAKFKRRNIYKSQRLRKKSNYQN